MLSIFELVLDCVFLSRQCTNTTRSVTKMGNIVLHSWGASFQASDSRVLSSYLVPLLARSVYIVKAVPSRKGSVGPQIGQSPKVQR